MVVAEAKTTPELAETFFQAGPQRSREQLWRLFDRPEIRARLRPELSREVLAVHLLNCLLGDLMVRTLFPKDQLPTPEELRQQADLGLDLFLRSALR